MNLTEDTLAVSQDGEGEMAQILCTHCGAVRELINQHPSALTTSTTWSHDVIRGTVRCKSCGKQTVFEMTANAISFAPGKLFEEDLRSASAMFSEALLCFYGQSMRGTVAMCRSAVEQALEGKNVKGNNLFELITNAQGTILGTEEVAQAHAARLSGRDTVHHMKSITQSQGMLALTATVDLLNHIGRQSPLPASP